MLHRVHPLTFNAPMITYSLSHNWDCYYLFAQLCNLYLHMIVAYLRSLEKQNTLRHLGFYYQDPFASFRKILDIFDCEFKTI